jgi:DNA-directed RNA polymerase specialized sigma24 family protein/ribosome-associated translation inhibitor RaiA
MSEHMIFQNCSAWQKDTIRSYWSQKLARIHRLLQHFPEDQREFRLTIRRRFDRFEVRAVLLLPTGTLVAESSAQMDNDAIDAVADKLAMEIRRHRHRIRHDDSHHRKRHRNNTIRHPAVLLESDIREPDRETFFEMLRPLMDRLSSHVHHELIMAQMQGRTQRRQLTVEDIRDEVILRAWMQLNDKDPTEPLDVWLMRLLHEVLDEQIPQVPAEVSIDREIDENDLDHEVETDEVTDSELLIEEPPVVTLDSLLPNHRASEPWQKLDLQDRMRWVLTQLSALPHVQRRAFTLHLLDGWDPDEIAMIQGRSSTDVREDIKEVQELLRSRLDGETGTEVAEAESADQTDARRR